MQTGVSRNLVPKLSRASVLRPTRRNAAPMRTSVRIRNGLLTLPTGVTRGSTRVPPRITEKRNVSRDPRGPGAAGRRPTPRERHARRRHSRGLARGERRSGVGPPGRPGSGVRASSGGERSALSGTGYSCARASPSRARPALRYEKTVPARLGGLRLLRSPIVETIMRR